MNNDMKNLSGSLVALAVIIALVVFVAKSHHAKADTKGSLMMQGDKSQQQKAKAQQPREKRYAIGNLGGAPVKMDLDWVEYIEYEEDPVAFDPKWKTYKAPKRTYHSYITSFGFDFDYKRGVLKDTVHRYEYREAQAKEAKKIENNSWVDFGVSSGSGYEEEWNKDKERPIRNLSKFAERGLSETYKKLDDGSVKEGARLDVLSAEGRKKAIKYQYVGNIYGLEYWRLPEDAVVRKEVGFMEHKMIPLRTTCAQPSVLKIFIWQEMKKIMLLHILDAV